VKGQIEILRLRKVYQKVRSCGQGAPVAGDRDFHTPAPAGGAHSPALDITAGKGHDLLSVEDETAHVPTRRAIAFITIFRSSGG
jgi:hypothetical protein